jgi:hypothetical protein
MEVCWREDVLRIAVDVEVALTVVNDDIDAIDFALLRYYSNESE